MARKRTIDEVESIQVDSRDVLDKPVASANVNAVITSLSPVKKGRTRNYFEGTVCDGKAKLRLVGFNLSQRTLMDNYIKSKGTVDLNDCQIQEAKRGRDMEVLIKNSTAMLKKISVSDMEFEASTPSTVTLHELEGKCIHERVTVDVKVQNAMDAEVVSTVKRGSMMSLCAIAAASTELPFATSRRNECNQ